MFKQLLGGEFPQLRQALDFGEFHPDLAGNAVEVWLNPSVAHLERWQALATAPELTPGLGTEAASLWAELWGCEAADAAALFAEPRAASLVTWLCARTWEIITSYAEERQKKGSR